MKKIMKLIAKFLKDNDGRVLEFFPLILTFCMGLSMFVNSLLPVIVTYFRLEMFSSAVVRDIEIYGGVDEHVLANIEKYKSTIISPDQYSYSDSDFIYGTKKIQLNHEVVFYCSKEVSLDFYIFTGFNVNITSNIEYGRSTVYWKE